MKTSLVVAASLALFASVPSARAIDLEEGLRTAGEKVKSPSKDAGNEPAPAGKPVDAALDFTFDDLDGKPCSWSQYRGKVALVYHGATWCPPCRASKPYMIELHEELGKEDFVMLAVNGGEKLEKVAAFYAKKPPYPLLIDEKGVLFKTLGISGIPTFILYDKEGKELSRHAGGMTPEVKAVFLKRIRKILEDGKAN